MSKVKIIGICPDCGKENELRPVTGICQKCTTRQWNAKSRGKEYIKYIDLPDEEKRKIDNMVAAQKRVSKITRTKVEKKENIVTRNENTTLSKRQDLREVVSNDVNRHLKERNLDNVLNTNNINIDVLLSWLENIMSDSSYIRKLKEIKDVYDLIMVDYIHELKMPIENVEHYAKIGEKIHILQELRTPIENELLRIQAISPVIEYLRGNYNLPKKIEESRENLDRILNGQENITYISNTESLQEYDMIKNKENGTINRQLRVREKYKIKPFYVKGLYGANEYRLFNVDFPTYGYSQQEAKEKFIKFFNKKFSNLEYSESAIKLEKV